MLGDCLVMPALPRRQWLMSLGQVKCVTDMARLTAEGESQRLTTRGALAVQGLAVLRTRAGSDDSNVPSVMAGSSSLQAAHGMATPSSPSPATSCSTIASCASITCVVSAELYRAPAAALAVAILPPILGGRGLLPPEEILTGPWLS